ncbi:MAG: HAD family phosphatase, partial [Bacteroidales bacterium]|nr:HAD family phosphatase [Bacteroidales bacterium]
IKIVKLSKATHIAKSEIKNIIFDWGGVITDLNVSDTLDAFIKLAKDKFNALWQKGPEEIFIPFELGKISAAEFRDRIRKFLGYDAEDQQIDDAWNTILGALPEERWRLLEKVKNTYRTFLLSNTNAIHLNYYAGYLSGLYGASGCSHLFEKTYFSFELGMRKPESDIFLHVIHQNGLKPQETLFIDDTEKNIETAQNLGLQTHLLAEPETLTDLFYEP